MKFFSKQIKNKNDLLRIYFDVGLNAYEMSPYGLPITPSLYVDYKKIKQLDIDAKRYGKKPYFCKHLGLHFYWMLLWFDFGLYWDHQQKI